MVVINRNPDLSKCPPNILPYARGASIGNHGDEFRVFAIVVFDGVAIYLILRSFGIPAWVPAWMFSIKDGSIPNHWICNSFSDWPELLVGPSFIVESQDSYRRMVELESDMVDLLHEEAKRVDI